LHRQIKQIQDDLGLQLYGLFLSLTHIWTFLHWHQGHFFVNAQSAINSEPICFPFWPQCDQWRSQLSPEQWSGVLWAYLALAIVTTLLFVRKQTAKWAFTSFALLSLSKLILHLSNYNFMGNYHYMVHIISLVYLFAPQRRELCKYLIVAFYFAAGMLKINIDWLSGAAMISTPWLGGHLLSFSLYYVIILELVLVFGLLHHLLSVRLFTLLQLIAFHVFSWHIVGFFYPMVMFSLLSLFVIDEFLARGNRLISPSLLSPLFRGQAPRTHYGALLIFALLQLIPYALSSDPSLSGAARLSSLNMFDAKTECVPLLVVHRSQQVAHLDRPLRSMGVRLACDPIVYLNMGKQLCAQQKKHKDFERLSLSLYSKRVTRSEYTQVLDVKDLCAMDNPLWAELKPKESL
jgi:hypothetical protein